jgi:hypothetical protein
MAIRASEEEIRTALQQSDLEMIGSGDTGSLRGFLERAAAQEAGPWAMVWLEARPLTQLAVPADAAVVSPAEGAPPRAIAIDEELLQVLANTVRSGVQRQGGCILDLREFGLSPETARKVAERAGVEVSIGLKAVYVPAGEAADREREERECHE